MTPAHTIRLYLPVQQLTCILKGLARLSERTTDKTMTVFLPDGSKIVVPHTMYRAPDVAERTFNAENPTVHFTTRLLLADDPAITAYVQQGDKALLQRISGKYSIGDFAVNLTCGTDYAVMAMSASVPALNPVLAESASLHRHLLDLLNTCDGRFALLDMGNAAQHLLGDLNRTVTVDAVDEDVDAIVHAVDAQLG